MQLLSESMVEGRSEIISIVYRIIEKNIRRKTYSLRDLNLSSCYQNQTNTQINVGFLGCFSPLRNLSDIITLHYYSILLELSIDTQGFKNIVLYTGCCGPLCPFCHFLLKRSHVTSSYMNHVTCFLITIGALMQIDVMANCRLFTANNFRGN